MARLARLSLAGVPQHLLQRGNNREAIFRDDEDRARYLEYLSEAAVANGVQVHAYALMDNHVHLLATPPDGSALARTMQAIGRRYVRGFNQRYARSGTLWEGRYRSHILEAETYLLPVSIYIETNPIRHKTADEAAHYAWSSYRHHAGLELNPLIQDHSAYWTLGNTPFERQVRYRGLLANMPSSQQLDAIRYSVHRGWALGSANFLQQLQIEGARQPLPLRRGRKPQQSR